MFNCIHFSIFYSSVLHDLLKKVSLGREGYGDSWGAMLEKLLLIYVASLSSNCRFLIQIIQVMLFFLEWICDKKLASNGLHHTDILQHFIFL